MLVHFSIGNFAIIDSLELSFGPGLTVLTGETGAGKSIIIDALSFLLGKRGQSDAIRAGASEARISGQFSFTGTQLDAVNAFLLEEEIPPCEDGALILRRVLHQKGRHKQFINGTLSTVSQLRDLSHFLVDFTSQRAQHGLLRPAAQMGVLDSFGGLRPLKEEVANAFGQLTRLYGDCQRIKELLSTDPRHADWLRYQLDELDTVDVQPGEEEELAQEQKRLHNVSQLQAGIDRAQTYISGGDDHDALSRIQCGAMELRKLSETDPQLGADFRLLEEAAALIDDVAHSLEKSAGTLEQDPARLEEIEDRLDAIRSLFRKHGGNLDGLHQAAEQMRGELVEYDEAASRLQEAKAKLDAEKCTAGAMADNLSAKRKAAARSLSFAIEKELKDLGMERAGLGISVTPIAASPDHRFAYGPIHDRRVLSITGSDRVEWALAANPGESPGPLAKVASGGELSRVLLATKRVLLSKDPVAVSVFDEVDQGVGGAIGEVIAEKLQAIGAERQVICITHLAQIAARADRHFVIEKNYREDRTVCEIHQLTPDSRVKELSRMIGGRKLTDAAQAHAEDLLNQASQAKDSSTKKQRPKSRSGASSKPANAESARPAP
jgi:DNA repair protein RecN (Recombination protein N)